MPDTNGKQKWSDIAHRIGIWGAVLGIGVYVLNMGMWVGAAEEKFKAAHTVEVTQKALLLQVNTVATKQESMHASIADNKTAIETSERRVVAAISALKD